MGSVLVQPAEQRGGKGVGGPGRPIIPGVCPCIHNRVSINVSGTLDSRGGNLFGKSLAT